LFLQPIKRNNHSVNASAMSYTVGGIKVLQRDSPSPTLPHAQYPGLKQETVVLPRGHRKDPSRKAFRAESILEKDVQVVTRNGHILQADVYRPAETKEQVPALLAWSPYGKSGTGMLRSHMASSLKQPCTAAVFAILYVLTLETKAPSRSI
jgi:predicted acyl esterase